MVFPTAGTSKMLWQIDAWLEQDGYTYTVLIRTVCRNHGLEVRTDSIVAMMWELADDVRAEHELVRSSSLILAHEF